MPFQMIRSDITRISADAIVNAANRTLLGGGGVDGAIHRAAGPELLAECRTIGGCPTGEARITRGYNLPCKYVIHTVGPVWNGGLSGESQALRSCYENALLLARQHGCESVAFPLISSGAYGYPYTQALAVAKDAILRFLSDHDDMTVYLVLYERQRITDEARFSRVQRFLAQHYQPPVFAAPSMAAPPEPRPKAKAPRKLSFPFFRPKEEEQEDLPRTAPRKPEILCESSLHPLMSLEEMLGHIDESFSQMVKRLIQEQGLTNAECYKRANLDKKLFSKINNDIHYKPKKPTAVALAIALQLDLDQTRELLMKAGYALSRSDKFDIIIEYFITTQNYDIFEINEVLFDYDQPLLGNVLL